jgi:hypothetical protein
MSEIEFDWKEGAKIVDTTKDGLLVTVVKFTDEYAMGKDQYSIFWELSLVEAKQRFLESGSVREDGVRCAEISQGRVTELHIMEGLGDWVNQSMQQIFK